jgi:hypothetical protein
MDSTAAEDVFTRRGLVSRIDVVVRRQAPLDATRAAIEAVLPPGSASPRRRQRKLDLHRTSCARSDCSSGASASSGSSSPT